MDVLERSKVSYWETRTINVGNFEKTECGLSISHSIIEPAGGYGNKKIKISEGASTSIDGSDVQDINKVSNHLIQVVQKKLNTIEKKVRMQVAEWEGIDYDTEKKLLVKGLIEEDEYTGAYKKRFEIDEDDLK